MPDARRILLVDNDSIFLSLLAEFLTLQGYEVSTAVSLVEARRVLQSVPIQLIVTDLRATDDNDARDRSGLVFAREFAPAIPKIMFTAWQDFTTVRQALSLPQDDGLPPAVDFVAKQEGLERLSQAVRDAFDRYVAFNFAQFKVGGALTGEDEAVYVPRQAEREVIEALRRMDYVLVIEPRQQGKTSLVNYLLRSPDLTNTNLVYVDVATADRSGPEVWYKSICARILQQLERIFPGSDWPGMPENSIQWRSFLTALAHKFGKAQRFLVIALDEIGSAFPGAAEFFGVLRDVINSREFEPHFKHVTFLLAGAFHPRDLISIDNNSPFNVSRRVRLHDFTLEQTRGLIGGFASGEQADILAARVYHWVSGQPYLTQQLCAHLRPNSTPTDVDRAVRRLRSEDENHLAPLLKRVRAVRSLKAYVARIAAGERIEFEPMKIQAQAQLELLGILKADDDGYCVFRCRLYEQLLARAATPRRTQTKSGKLQAKKSTPGDIAGTSEPKRRDIAPAAADSTPKPANAKASAKLVILFLAADPSDASRLRLGEELREIQEKLRMARMRHKFDLRPRTSVRPIDISQAILDDAPRIVHFSGHGTSAGELRFENEMGQTKRVSPKALSALFELVAEQVDCVLMNACYSAVQAEAIAEHIKYVIGMDKEISDRAAISFAAGFYQALGAGKSIEDAYKFGCVQIALQGIPERTTPVLLKGRSPAGNAH